jgi:hypothetical protein
MDYKPRNIPGCYHRPLELPGPGLPIRQGDQRSRACMPAQTSRLHRLWNEKDRDRREACGLRAIRGSCGGCWSPVLVVDISKAIRRMLPIASQAIRSSLKLYFKFYLSPPDLCRRFETRSASYSSSKAPNPPPTSTSSYVPLPLGSLVLENLRCPCPAPALRIGTLSAEKLISSSLLWMLSNKLSPRSEDGGVG